MFRSNLYKIYALGIGLLIFAAIMFGFVFRFFDNRNDKLYSRIAEKKSEYQALQAEQRSYQAAKDDLQKLSGRDTQPDQLFSQDTKLVKEIKSIEDLAEKNNLESALTISGTTDKAKKAPGVKSNIYLIPYTLTVTGSFEGSMKFLQGFEHLPFAVHVQQVDFSIIQGGEIRVSLGGEFYIQK